MTLPSTSTTLRQAGIVRIEIAAISMLLIALATILIMHAPKVLLPENVQVVVPAQDLASVQSDALTHVVPQPRLQPASVMETNMP